MSDNAPAERPTKLEDQLRQACRVRHYSLATRYIRRSNSYFWRSLAEAVGKIGKR